MSENYKIRTGNDSFKEHKIASYALKSATDNLDVREVVIHLNEMVYKILNTYRSNGIMNFSEIINMFCENNINELEALFSTDHNKWLKTLDDYITLSSVSEMYSDVVMDYLYIPKTRSSYKRHDVHFVIDKNHMDRIDNLKNNILFKNASRDTILTYLVCLDEFDTIGDIFKSSVIEIMRPFKLELTRCRDSIENNYIKLNSTLIKYVLTTGFIKPDTALLLRYIDETLNLYKKEFENDKNIVKNNEFKESIMLIKSFAEEMTPILKKNDNKIIIDYVKVINEKINIFNCLFE